jgi:hypothetical protein
LVELQEQEGSGIKGAQQPAAASHLLRLFHSRLGLGDVNSSSWLKLMLVGNWLLSRVGLGSNLCGVLGGWESLEIPRDA